jgi:hypothetical protein
VKFVKIMIALDFGFAGFNAGNAIDAAVEGRAWSVLIILTCAFVCALCGALLLREAR